MDKERIAKLRARVSQFEDIIYQARSVQHADLPPEVAALFLKDDPVLAWRLLDFFDSYLSSRIYPSERLAAVIDRLIDTKLELHFVTQVWPGTMNLMVYLRGFDPKDPGATPNLQLARLGYSQAMIGAIRILWERLMRLICYLEMDRDPEGKSTQRKFFRELPNWSARWDLLAEFESEIGSYDASYRTPEYHKGSILKRELLGGKVVDINDVMGLMTPITNGVWTVLMANVSGTPHNIVRLGRRIRPEDPTT